MWSRIELPVGPDLSEPEFYGDLVYRIRTRKVRTMSKHLIMGSLSNRHPETEVKLKRIIKFIVVYAPNYWPKKTWKCVGYWLTFSHWSVTSWLGRALVEQMLHVWMRSWTKATTYGISMRFSVEMCRVFSSVLKFDIDLYHIPTFHWILLF